jgi:agmatinase
VQDVEPFSTQQIVDAGDIAANRFNIAEAVAQIEEAATRLGVDGTRLLTIGGDHTIALPAKRAVTKRTGPVAAALRRSPRHRTLLRRPCDPRNPFRRASEEKPDRPRSESAHPSAPALQQQDLKDDARLGFAVIAAHEFETEGLARSSNECSSGSATVRSTSRSTSTFSDPSHAPAPALPRREVDEP